MTEETASEQHDHHRGSDPLLRPVARRRTAIALTVNLAVFAVACCFFWQYLATGRWLDLSIQAYRAGVNTPLSRMFVHPLSIFAHPWMIPINSLLLALMFCVPVMIAVMYHEVVALAFVLVVAAVGRAPALALLQAVGVLATRTPLRRESPFLAAMLGMSPLLMYMAIVTLTVEESARLPLQRWVLYSVVATALLLGTLAAAGALGLVKLFRYRPGALCPVMVVMLAAGALAFYGRVGSDELEYALLVARIDRPGEPDSLFESGWLEKWQESHGAEGLGRDELRKRLKREVARRRDGLIDRCNRFLSAHGDSDRAPGVLWLKAQLQSLVLDEATFEAAYSASHLSDGEEARAVLITCSAEFVAVDADGVAPSYETWRRLLTDHSGSVHAVLARWRLGQLALRQQDVSSADELLKAAEKRLLALRVEGAVRSRQGDAEGVFAARASIPRGKGRLRYYDKALKDVGYLLWLMRENRVRGSVPAAEALAAYLNVSSRDPDRRRKLKDLANTYEGTLMGDNLKLAVALTATNTFDKAKDLIELAKDELTDAGIEANFHLGCLRMSTGPVPALPLMDKLKKPEDYFKIVAKARANPWQRDAGRRLAELAVRPRPPE